MSFCSSLRMHEAVQRNQRFESLLSPSRPCDYFSSCLLIVARSDHCAPMSQSLSRIRCVTTQKGLGRPMHYECQRGVRSSCLGLQDHPLASG